MKTRVLIVAAGVLLGSWMASAQSGGAPQASQDRALIDEVVIANHILANEGVLDAYGHVSVRDERNPNHFYLARHVAAGLVTVEDILEYDLDTRPVVQGQGTAGYTERFIHGEIYRARPDVKAIVHTHAPELVPFSASSVPLQPISHMAGFLGEGVAKFEIREAGGVTDMLISTPQLGRALAQTLADKPAALMRGHGAVVVAPSLHVVVGRAYYMASNARLQAQAIMLGGKVTYLETGEAKKAAPQDGFERAWALWKARVSR
jgi:ribulose-5-phosphate 4-epimerase/fuculose-1-phosphate aldolase